MRRINRSFLLGVASLSLGLIGSVDASEWRIVVPGILQREPDSSCYWVRRPYGESYVVTNIGSFQEGDTVLVTGERADYCECHPFQTYPCLPDNTISPWRRFDFGCGVISVDWEYGCAGFRSDTYGPFTLLDPQGHQDGDTVRMVGTLVLDTSDIFLIPECWFGDFMGPRTLSACGDTATAVVPMSWGQVRAIWR